MNDREYDGKGSFFCFLVGRLAGSLLGAACRGGQHHGENQQNR
jgi:hypothetical protein